jgi:hypothetical protein
MITEKIALSIDIPEDISFPSIIDDRSTPIAINTENIVSQFLLSFFGTFSNS